jgi:hypothetical protein
MRVSLFAGLILLAPALGGCWRLNYRGDRPPPVATAAAGKEKTEVAEGQSPAAAPAEGRPTLLQRVDQRAAEVRDRLAKWHNQASDRIEAAMDSSVAACIIMPVGIVGYVLGHGHSYYNCQVPVSSGS